MDAETLSRIQFALTISFHFIYPPLSMGLGLMLVVLGVIYVRTHNPMCDVVDWKDAGTAGPFACGAAGRRRSVVAGRIVADAGRPCRSPPARAIIGPDPWSTRSEAP